MALRRHDGDELGAGSASNARLGRTTHNFSLKSAVRLDVLFTAAILLEERPVLLA